MANSDDRYEMLRDRELSKLSWVVKIGVSYVLGRARQDWDDWKQEDSEPPQASLAHILSGSCAEIRKKRVTSCGSWTNTRRGRQQESNGKRRTQKTPPHS